MLLLCSQALCVARKLYKLLAIVDHAYLPNLHVLLQSLLCMLKLCIKFTKYNISVNKARGVCALRALVVFTCIFVCIVHVL